MKIPWTREQLASATKRVKTQAITWQEAKKRALLWLMKMHFPRAFGYAKPYVLDKTP